MHSNHTLQNCLKYLKVAIRIDLTCSKHKNKMESMGSDGSISPNLAINHFAI